MLESYPGPNNNPYQSPPRHQTASWVMVNRPPTLYMLVMGPQGCGKSVFVNLAIGQPECATAAAGFKLCTRLFRFCKGLKSMNGCDFKFTDTPGFGNEIMDDKRIIELLVGNLIHIPYGDRNGGPSMPQTRKVTGLLYIHSEDESFKNRTSRKTIETLVKIFGEQFLNRITVLIWSPNGLPVDYSSFMPSADSPLYPFYCHNIKPRTMSYEGSLQSVERILGLYTAVHPRPFRLPTLEGLIQRHGDNWRHSDIPQYLNELLLEDTNSQAAIDPPSLESRIQELEIDNQRLRNLVAQKQEEMAGLQSAHETQLKTLQTERLRETFNYNVGTKRLENTIQDQQIEISNLKLTKDSELEKLEKSKNDEVSELRDKLQAKDEELTKLERSKSDEISKLGSEKDSEIKVLEDKLQEKGEELMRTKTDYERRISESANATQIEEKGTVGGVNGAIIKSESKRENEIERLNSEIHRISAEYASLRNHMQLEENTELADITTALGDINRLIEEFGGSLIERVEKHMEDNAATESIQPQDLLGLFGQVGNETASKLKLDAYLLLEYAVEATICELLCTHLFKPFHPSIAEDESRNMFMIRLYEQMTHQEAQSVAGRWRKDAFNSISRDPSYGNPDNSRMHRLVTGALSALLEKVIKIQPHEILKEHDRALVKFITKAEDLNRMLKGDVSMLGDFQPVVFPFGESFQPDYMTEISSSKSKRANHPEMIVATVELGIVKRYAVGGSRKPEETVLRRAGVLGLPK